MTDHEQMFSEKSHPDDLAADFCVRLATATDVVGGKFAALCRLSSDGITVPSAFCLTTRAFATDLQHCISASLLLSFNESQRLAEYQRSAELGKQISEAIRNHSLPRSLVEVLRNKLSQLRYPVVVRSSAAAEDSPTRSFAGVFDSVLGLTREDQIFEAIKQCWASLFSERALAYCRSFGETLENAKMALICQTMIVPSVAGVLFTRDPIKTGHVLTINASWGLPSLLVGGEIVPDLYELGQNGQVLDREIGSKKLVSEYVDGRLMTRRTSPSENGRYCLTGPELSRLFECGKKIESIFGLPQDIEWAIQSGTLYVLQSRAITTPPIEAKSNEP